MDRHVAVPCQDDGLREKRHTRPWYPAVEPGGGDIHVESLSGM